MLLSWLLAPFGAILDHPLLALLPAIAFFATYAALRVLRGRQPGLGLVLAAALAWTGYAPYELHMTGVLKTGST